MRDSKFNKRRLPKNIIFEKKFSALYKKLKQTCPTEGIASDEPGHVIFKDMRGFREVLTPKQVKKEDKKKKKKAAMNKVPVTEQEHEAAAK